MNNKPVNQTPLNQISNPSTNRRLVRSNCWCCRGTTIYSRERVDLFVDGTFLNIVKAGTDNVIESIDLRTSLTRCSYEGTISFMYKDNQKLSFFKGHPYLYTSMPGASLLFIIIRWFSAKDAKELSKSLNRYSGLSK
jgi:hypothetical protein